jgi:glycosyltransferase involved in cell wall biosynthesis
VGQIIPAKGLDLLLEALARLVARGRDVTLDVVGDVEGWSRPEYRAFRDAQQARAQQRDLAGRVRFLGWREDVPTLLATSGVHCCPSRPEMHEGMPLVVIEAKQAGIPTVAFAHGPFPELIDQGRTGWLCDELTAESLATGLDRYLNDPAALTASAEPVRASIGPFSREVFARGWSDVFAARALPSPT